MQTEEEQYPNRIVTVVGGRGQLGCRIVKGLEGLGVKDIRICEQGDPFIDFVNVSTDLFFATDSETARDMLIAARDLLKTNQTVLDGASVKESLIPLYKELDNQGISVCSTHLGAVPTQPWPGVKVWICNIGPNSEKARQLATDLYITKNTSIQIIPIEEHKKVEKGQWFTMTREHLFGAALRNAGITIEELDRFSTLNGELTTLPLGRTLGQGVIIPTEVIFTQPRKQEFLGNLLVAFCEFVHALDSEEGLKEFLQTNIDFHNNPDGTVNRIFRKAGTVGSRLANIRMCSLSFRIHDDRPGRLTEISRVFYQAGVNLTAIDSMLGNITPEEIQLGIDPEKIIDFDIGIDPKTIDPKKEQRIKDGLREIGCVID